MKDLLRSLAINVHILLLSLLLVGLGMGMIRPTTVQRGDGGRKRTVITVFNHTPGVRQPKDTPVPNRSDEFATAPGAPSEGTQAEPKTGSPAAGSPLEGPEATCQPCTSGNCQSHCLWSKGPQTPSCEPRDPYGVSRPTPLYCPEAG